MLSVQSWNTSIEWAWFAVLFILNQDWCCKDVNSIWLQISYFIFKNRLNKLKIFFYRFVDTSTLVLVVQWFHRLTHVAVSLMCRPYRCTKCTGQTEDINMVKEIHNGLVKMWHFPLVNDLIMNDWLLLCTDDASTHLHKRLYCTFVLWTSAVWSIPKSLVQKDMLRE